jgi:hypothetical protein
MTEAEWLGCADPSEMLELLRGKVSDRKLRLFGCACVRLVWSLTGEEPPTAVETAEGFADHVVTKTALRRSRGQVRKERHGLEAAEAGMRPRWGAYWLTEVVASEKACGSVVAEMSRLSSDILILEEHAWSRVCGLLRDIFSNPFRHILVSPATLRWNDATIPKLAQGIYDERAFDRLPILADALEESGCDTTDLLAHCREPGVHVRGCWALDQLLGKE